jgi:hypothetical protein
MTAQTCNWIGKSRKTYEYYIFNLPPNLKAIPGNYIFTKQNDQGKWVPVYIGETKDLSERFNNHHKTTCINRKGATHLHAHINDQGLISRQTEEQDLLDNYTNTIEPQGCNG